MRLPNSLDLSRCPIARFSLVLVLFVAVLCTVMSGCSYTYVSPDGAIRQAAVGQAKTRHCETRDGDTEDRCTETSGGAISDGFMNLLRDLVRLPFVAVGGAASAVAGK